jgi:hypothetical protein
MCVAQDARSHTYNRERGHIHACVHACIQTHVHALHVYLPSHNAIVYTMHKCAPLLRTHASRLCTALTRVIGVWSCGQVLQQCAAFPPCLRMCRQGCTHMCVREERYSARTMCVHTTECEVIYAHAYVMPCTYTYRHSSAQRNSIYHAQTCATTTH